MNKLEPFFNPKSVLIVGVSRKTYTFSYTILKNLLEIFYRGKLYIVNPKATEILGVNAYHSLEELPEVPELAIIVLGKNIADVFEELGKFGVKYIAIESEIPKELTVNIKKDLDDVCQKYDISYMGPSMIGIIDYINNFTTSIIPVRQYIIKQGRKEGAGISFLAQSGGLSGALGWWAPTQVIPFSKVVHLGEGFDINEAEILHYFIKDHTTKVVVLFLKDISEGVINAVKDLAAIKPVLFYYVGKDSIYKEKLIEAGGIEVDNYIELFEFAKLFLWCPEPLGPNLGIIGPSSGAIYIIVKEMRKQDLSLGKLKTEAKERILEKVGGSTCQLGNPVDYWPPERFIGTKVCEIYNTSSHTLLRDDSIDGLILALEFFNEIEFDFTIFKRIRKEYPRKPIITILIQAEHEGSKRVINQATELKIPVFDNEIERAVRGYRILYNYYSKIKKKKE